MQKVLFIFGDLGVRVIFTLLKGGKPQICHTFSYLLSAVLWEPPDIRDCISLIFVVLDLSAGP